MSVFTLLSVFALARRTATHKIPRQHTALF
jgi:hypothetical protein